jgi:hypothetical protein
LIRLRSARIPAWERTCGASKVQIAIEAMLCIEDHTLHTLNFNLNPSLSSKPISQNYIRDQIRSAIKRTLRTDMIFFVLVKEFTETIWKEECRLLSDDEYKKLSRRSFSSSSERIKIVDYEEMSSKI